MTIAINTDPVETNKVAVEALDEIWWQGRQWAVTSYGIESRDGKYYIERNRLSEATNDPPGLPDWPHHMARKKWVDIDDFCTAFMVGLVLHGQADAFPHDVVRETCERACLDNRKMMGDEDRAA